MILWVSHTPNPRGRGPSVPEIYGSSYMFSECIPVRNSNLILHGDQTRCEEIFLQIQP